MLAIALTAVAGRGEAQNILDFVTFDGVDYVRWVEEPGRAVTRAELGLEFATVECSMADDRRSCPFGVDAADLLDLFSRFGVLVDVAFWTAQPATTLGLCPGVLTAAIVVTTAPTKGAANACPPTGATLGAGIPGAALSAR